MKNRVKFVFFEVINSSATSMCSIIQRCTGAGVSESTPAGVLTIFENRSGAGVDFCNEEPEWSRSQFFNERLVFLFFIVIVADCFFTKHVIT